MLGYGLVIFAGVASATLAWFFISFRPNLKTAPPRGWYDIHRRKAFRRWEGGFREVVLSAFFTVAILIACGCFAAGISLLPIYT